MAELAAGASLRQLQDYAREHARERGFADTDVVAECLLLAEEVGELAKAVRKAAGHRVAVGAQVSSVADELADVLWVTTMLANICGVDLEAAFRAKEVVNHGRRWE